MRKTFPLPKRFIKILGACLFLFYSFAGQAQTATISGKVPNAEGLAIVITGTVNDVVLTNQAGEYSVTLPVGGSYNLRPYSNKHVLNGVTTYDNVLVAMHLEGSQPLSNPYKIIAADIDHSNSVNSPDTFYLRRVILGIIEDFPNNSSWRFVRSDYVFPDPTNPFLEPIPESFSVNNLTTDISGIDFVPIKVGDVNGSALLDGVSLTDDVYLSKILGHVAFDENLNCLIENGELPLENWLVEAQNASTTYTTTTDANGYYRFVMPPGDYLVKLIPPNPLWEACFSTANEVSVGLSDTVTLDLPAKPLSLCPYMTVDLSTPFLRRCFENTYTIQYCNKGTATAENAYVQVSFDPYLTVVSSTIPWVSDSNNTYVFPVGNMVIGDCGTFSVKVLVNCDAALGQTHCSSAFVYPDTLCLETPGWSGASLEVTGRCEAGDVIFTVTNKGADMTQSVDYVVFEDIMIQMTGNSFQLNQGQRDVITIPANGSTWRMELEQPANHPFGTLISAAVEGCGTNGGGAFSLGLINQFPLGDESPNTDEDCQENIGAFDPNDKQGFPRGVGVEHRIPKNLEMEYMIRFQNTGTDTAFTVMILDTIPTELDIKTIRAGVSSHPYVYNVLGEGVLQFVFSNILLPDSNVNEAASHGYVKFAIKQQPNLPDDTKIENEAGIYFDFNEPVITNRTLHTVGDLYLNISTISFRPGVSFELYPNPTGAVANFIIKDIETSDGTLYLYNGQGQFVRAQAFSNNKFELDVQSLVPGMYLFRIDRDGVLLGTGKLIIGGTDR